MRIHIYQKHQNKIVEVGKAIDRSPQFIVNMIVDNLFTNEEPEKILKEMMIKNLEKLMLKNNNTTNLNN